MRVSFGDGLTAVATKPLTLDGKSFKVGQAVPWQKLGVPERKARQLWETRFINCRPAKATTKTNVTEVAPA